jgi:hypothetical protein
VRLSISFGARTAVMPAGRWRRNDLGDQYLFEVEMMTVQQVAATALI